MRIPVKSPMSPRSIRLRASITDWWKSSVCATVTRPSDARSASMILAHSSTFIARGFFDEDVRVRLQRRCRYGGMRARRRTYVNEVGAFRRQHPPNVGIGRRNAEIAAHRFGPGAVQVADGGDSHVPA